MTLTAAELTALLEVPDFLTPWLDRFYDSNDIDLLAELAEGPLSADELAERTGADSRDLDRAWLRGVVDKTDDGRFQAGDFHERYDKWALFEGWQDVPAEVMDQLNAWELEFYIDKHRPTVAGLKESRPAPLEKVTPRYLLLDETMEVIDAAPAVYLWPCNCRSMYHRCDKPVNTCLRFRNSKGIGWEISKERAKELAVEFNRAGLMQCGEIGVKEDGSLTGAICNCCSDCCYPHQLAEADDAAKIWPLSRYIARRVEDQCSSCGLCVKRCPFGAFTAQWVKNDEGKKRRQIGFEPDLCRGCGVCVTGCPDQAIEMDLLAPGLADPIRPVR